MTIYILIFLNILLLVFGQILWKIGLMRLPNKDMITIVTSIFTPYIFLGVLVYGVATFLWLFILSKKDLSMVYPLQSLTYVLGMVSAYLFLNEKIPVIRWLGALLIIIGAYFIAKS